MHGKPEGRSQGPFHVRKQVPDLRPLDAIVRRGPHFDPPFLPPIKPVGHYAVGRRQPARGHVGLHRAGHAGEAGHEVDDLPGRRHLAELRHDGDVFFRRPGMVRRMRGMAKTGYSWISDLELVVPTRRVADAVLRHLLTCRSQGVEAFSQEGAAFPQGLLAGVQRPFEIAVLDFNADRPIVAGRL